MKITTLKSKIWLGLICGLVCGTVWRRLSFKYLSPWISTDILLFSSILLLITGIIIPFIWNKRDRQKLDTSAFRITMQSLLFLAVALDLTMFGWQKIEGLQMIVPLGMLDDPFSDFSGENLVWAFFRYSYPFTVTIAITQIVIAMLLVFPKTRLLGLIMAVPILVFIISMDYFYTMPVGVLAHALVILISVFYLLSLDHLRIKIFLFTPMDGLSVPDSDKKMKYIHFSILLISPLCFYFIYDFPDNNPALTGKYTVEQLVVNNIETKAVSPRDSILTQVYFDLDDDIVFRFNDYRSKYIGKYNLDEKTGNLQINWRYPSIERSQFTRTFSKDQKQLVLKGRMKGENLLIVLHRSTVNKY